MSAPVPDPSMTDLYCLSLAGLWFVLTAGFIRFCDRLMPRDRERRP
jgi:hypothetical protein